MNKTRNELARVDFDVDIDQFKKEIRQLLNECNLLRKEEEKYRHKIVQLQTDKIRLEAQIEVVAKTHDELSEDYKFAVQDVDDWVMCPTCGAEYSNSFSERFQIAEDTETCMDLLKSLRDDLNKVKKEIITTEKSLVSTSRMQKNINSLLATKQGQVKLNDLVRLEGKKELLIHLDAEYDMLNKQLEKLVVKVNELQKEMKKFDDKERRKDIIKKYAENLRRFTSMLEVTSLDEKAFKKIDSNISESGSDLPRAVLAYNFTVLKAIGQNDSAIFCPIVIDAPNQQEQDASNLVKILNFISNKRPKNHQLVLGLVDDSDVDFDGQIIELKRKNSLLDENEYLDVSKEIKYYEQKNLEYIH